MIHDALQRLVNNLNDALADVGSVRTVSLGNIARLDALNADSEPSVILSLVNVVEEATLKNGTRHHTEEAKAACDDQRVGLCLSLLFSARSQDYGTALQRLESIIQYFQSRRIFTVRSGANPEKQSRAPEDLAGFRLTLELDSLSFEQVNHLWGSLGGKQVPFVLYRARLISLTEGEFQSTEQAMMNTRDTGPRFKSVSP